MQVLIVCQYLFPHETKNIKQFETYISMAIYISKSSSQKSFRLKYKLRTGSIHIRIFTWRLFNGRVSVNQAEQDVREEG